MTLTNQALNLQPANTQYGGVISTATQSIAGIKTFTNTSQATDTLTGSVVISGGLAIAKDLHIGGKIVIGGATISRPTSGTYTLTLPTSDGNDKQVLQTDGSGNLSWVDPASGGGGTSSATYTVTDTTEATDTATGVLLVAGGCGIAKTLYVKTEKIVDTAQATDTSTGCLVCSGGVSVAKNLHVGGNISGTLAPVTMTVSGTTASTDTATGALIVAGGMGVAKSLYVGGPFLHWPYATSNPSNATRGDMYINTNNINAPSIRFYNGSVWVGLTFQGT
jgi:cytoskeletal protein CcmA (bactofilin family)